MASCKQTFPNADKLKSSIFLLTLSSSSCSVRAGRYFAAVVLAVFASLMSLTPIISSSAPPEHAQFNLSSAALPEKAQSKHNSSKPWARGRILVAPRAGLPSNAFANILKEHDGKARKIGQSNLYIVNLPEYTEEGVITKLAHHPHLKFVELDHFVSPNLIPNDPYYNYNGDAWHHPKIGTPLAWDSSKGAGITIAILDSGVDDTHPDLAAQMVMLHAWNFFDNNSNTSDVVGHGTYVSGSAAAITNNNTGVAGVAGLSKIMPLRVTDNSGIGYSSTISQGLIHAADNGAHIANASFYGLPGNLTIRNAAQYMKDKGGLVFVSAGNTGVQENFAVTTTMIPISATDTNDIISSTSSYGDYIALAAPGIKIWSTRAGGSYGAVSGTSFSSPIVSGVAALMMSANPQLSNLDIENLLFSTAVDLGDPGKDIYYGQGRVDAAAAVEAAIAAAPSVDTEAPTASIVEPLGGATVAGLVPVDVDASDNVGVTRAELRVNGTIVAVDTSTPFAFSWDSNGAPNGVANLAAHVFDAADNMASSTVEVNVDNSVQPPPTEDTEPPIVTIINPVAGNVSGNISISIDASDNSGAAGITLSIFIDGSLSATGTGSTLGTNWNTRPKRVHGIHTIQAVAEDAAGNTSTAAVNVNVVK